MHDTDTRLFDTAPTYAEFSDPRLVAIYDTVNPIAEYRAFYLALAATLSATSIIDIGCGTGLFTFELAEHGHNMIGVEPAPAMLDLARRRSYATDVQWIEADASKLRDVQADLAIMTGHVAQFFLDDDRWQGALTAIHEALRPGGHLAFESRNPLVQPWADGQIECHIDWPSSSSRRRVDDPVAGEVEWWTEILVVSGTRMRYEIHYLFAHSGEELESVGELVFRTQAELERSLADAGFSTERIYGDWDGRPASAGSRELIFVARRG